MNLSNFLHTIRNHDYRVEAFPVTWKSIGDRFNEVNQKITYILVVSTPGSWSSDSR